MRALVMRLLSVPLAVGSLWATDAHAIPAFARKYGTSCQTCHTVYPKLNPFGEAFRHNGYRFPGVDSDYVKQEPVPLGQEGYKKTFPNSVWPGLLASSPPIAVGFNGTATVHPDKNVTGAAADNNTQFTMQDLIGEGHVWVGGSYDDHMTYWGEITFGSDGSVDVERAQVLVNDIVGPAHAVNAIVGRGVANVSSFGPHSSYVSDNLMPSVQTTALLGAQGDSFNIGDNYNFVELNGVVAGRVMYNVGLTAGQHFDVRPTENFYGHVGVKLGGLRFDGEGSSGPGDAEHPWRETALTLDGFFYKSNSHFTPASFAPGATPQMDPAFTVGGGLRAQWGSLELNSGVYSETHNNAVDGAAVDPTGAGFATSGGATMVAQYNELSYIVFPWLVPSVRVEYTNLQPAGGQRFNDLRVFPGVAMLIRPNLKAVLYGTVESANATPPGGWGGTGGVAAPSAGRATELEGLTLWVATAF